MLSKSPTANQSNKQTTIAATIGWAAAWIYAIVAGGGGLWLLITRGPWPLTNGWFALFSGASACPATSWFLSRYAGLKVSGTARFAAAAFFFVAGRIALALRS